MPIFGVLQSVLLQEHTIDWHTRCLHTFFCVWKHTFYVFQKCVEHIRLQCILETHFQCFQNMHVMHFRNTFLVFPKCTWDVFWKHLKCVSNYTFCSVFPSHFLYVSKTRFVNTVNLCLWTHLPLDQSSGKHISFAEFESWFCMFHHPNIVHVTAL